MGIPGFCFVITVFVLCMFSGVTGFTNFNDGKLASPSELAIHGVCLIFSFHYFYCLLSAQLKILSLISQPQIKSPDCLMFISVSCCSYYPQCTEISMGKHGAENLSWF